ncbi:MAG: CIA30 family protein [Pseudomonadota bacterium]
MILLFMALFLATQTPAASLPANTIFTIEDGKTEALLLPSKAVWTLKNDKTERPGVGKTESSIEKKDETVLMRGFLASLPGNWGRVGFSLMEAAITKPIQRSLGIKFRMHGTDGLWASVLVKDRQWNQPEGTLTFQWEFEVKPEPTEYEAPWSEFVPTIRGKKVSGYEIDLFSVQALSFQVARSQQKKWYETSPLEFEIKL